MTDLTEQWKKGELPAGYYYVKNEFNNIFPSDYSESYDSINDAVIKDFFTEVSEIKEVIAPVPSYKEWKAKLEENARLKENIHSMLFTDDVVQDRYDKVKEENAQLKELLKEIRSKIKTVYDMDLREFITSAVFDDSFVTKIDEALK